MSFHLRDRTGGVTRAIFAVVFLGSCSPTQVRILPSPKPVADDALGVLTVEDLCLDDEEVHNGYLDDDGCPDELPNRVRCETATGLWVGGVGGPLRPGCLGAEHEILVSTFDDTENPRELHRLSALAGLEDTPLAGFTPAVLVVEDRSGTPAHAATVTYTGLSGEVRSVRAGMDGRIVLDRAQVHEESSILVDGCGAQKALQVPLDEARAVTLPTKCADEDAPPSLNIAVVIDADAEMERERVIFAQSLQSILSALRRSNGVVPKIAVFDSSGVTGPGTFTEDYNVAVQRVRGASSGGSNAPREALAEAFSRASEADWPASEANVLVLLSRRSPIINSADLSGVDRLRRAGVRVHPVMGRAPFVIDEVWVRWISAITGGDVRLRAVWGDTPIGGEVHPSVCPVFETLEWSIIRMLREESDGIDRSPPPGLLHGAEGEVPGGVCSGAPSWRLLDSPERGIISAYGPGKADLGPEFDSVFEDVLQKLQIFPELGLEIIGHCDTSEVPSKQGREALSLLRAKRARAVLIEHGVSPERVSVKGWGGGSPDDDGGSTEARSRNRRIEMRLRVYKATQARH